MSQPHLSPSPTKRALRWTLALSLLGALLYAVWPYWSGWQLRAAMRAKDTAALQSRVDWPTLRANLKPRIAAAVEAEARGSGTVSGYLKRLVGSAVADKGVDLFVTPGNLARILAGREFVTSRLGKAPQPAPTPQGKTAPADDVEDPDDPVPPRRVTWAFFESPTRFRVEATHPRLPDARIVTHLALQGFGWRLVDINVVPATR